MSLFNHCVRFAVLSCWLLLAMGASGCAHWLYPVQERADDVITIYAKDGWPLAVHYFPADPSVEKRQTPVLICHGISSNKYNWDLSDDLSFPEYMASLGYDTYLLELRGAGHSADPGAYPQPDRPFSFDDYVLQDLPAAIEFVAKKSPTGQVNWVGHSMGSIVMYAYMQRGDQDLLKSVVAVGSPPRVFDHNKIVTGAAKFFPLANALFDHLPLRFMSKSLAPFAYPGWLPPLHILWNYDNVSAKTAVTAGAHAVDDLSNNVLQQFVNATHDGYFSSLDKEHNYTAGMGKVKVPIFFIAGALDQLAPPVIMYEAFRSVSSKDKKIEVLSQANGYAHDYGHVDLVLGESAPREVYPLIATWLEDHDG